MNMLPTADMLPEPLAGLVRDHEHVHELVGDARATFDRAVLYGPETDGPAYVLEVARDLERFLARDLTLHIAKEEEVLFPALRALADEMDGMVEYMVAQHDEIRARRELIEQAMAALDAHHNEIEEERDAFASGVRVAAALTPEALAGLRERATRLHWILEGHFGDEEENLFVPALALLSPEVLAELTERMAALERAMPSA